MQSLRKCLHPVAVTCSEPIREHEMLRSIFFLMLFDKAVFAFRGGGLPGIVYNGFWKTFHICLFKNA